MDEPGEPHEGGAGHCLDCQAPAWVTITRTRYGSHLRLAHFSICHTSTTSIPLQPSVGPAANGMEEWYEMKQWGKWACNCTVWTELCKSFHLLMLLMFFFRNIPPHPHYRRRWLLCNIGTGRRSWNLHFPSNYPAIFLIILNILDLAKKKQQNRRKLKFLNCFLLS